MAEMTTEEAVEFLRLAGIYLHAKHRNLQQFFDYLPEKLKIRFRTIRNVLKERADHGRVPDQELLRKLQSHCKTAAFIDGHDLAQMEGSYHYGYEWDTLRDPASNKFQIFEAHRKLSRIERAFRMVIAGKPCAQAMGEAGIYWRSKSPTKEQMDICFDFEQGKDFMNPNEWGSFKT